LSTFLIGCLSRDTGDTDAEPDAGVSAFDPPSIDDLPASTPITTVAIRGSTVGARIVTQGGADGIAVTSVLPGGSFCQDASLLTGGQSTSLSIYAVSGDGRASEPITAEVLYDPLAPMPANARCSGTSGGECAAVEICDNEVDDDCDGWQDECDLSCSGCVDDAFEPNDFPINVPSLLPDQYSLKLCPCHDDWFAFIVGLDERIQAIANFDNDTINISMRLFRAKPDGNGTAEMVDYSFSSTNEESIDYRAEQAGTYFPNLPVSIGHQSHWRIYVDPELIGALTQWAEGWG